MYSSEQIKTLVKKYSGNHNYHQTMISRSNFSSFGTSLYTFLLGYMISLPYSAICEGTDGFSSMNPSEACGVKEQCTFVYEFEGWHKRYSMGCERELEFNMLLTLLFFSNSILSVINSVLIDKIGRKRVLIMGSYVYLVSGFLIWLVDDIYMRFLFLSVMAGFNVSSSTSASILMKEWSYDDRFANITSKRFVLYSLGAVFLGIATMYLQESESILLLCFVVLFVTVFQNFYSYIESPVFLSLQNNKEELLLSISQYAAANGIQVSSSEIDLEEEQPSGSLQIRPSSFKVLEKEDQIMMEPFEYYTTLVILSVEMSSLYLVFYGLGISIDSIGINNIHVNSIMMGVSSILGYKYADRLVYYERKKAKFVVYSSMAAVGILLILMKDATSSPAMIIKGVLSIGILNALTCLGFTSFFMYGTEVFPANSRGKSVGIAACVGRMFSSVSPHLKTYSLRVGINPVVSFCAPLLLVLPLISFLRETKKVDQDENSVIHQIEEVNG